MACSQMLRSHHHKKEICHISSTPRCVTGNYFLPYGHREVTTTVASVARSWLLAHTSTDTSLLRLYKSCFHELAVWFFLQIWNPPNHEEFCFLECDIMYSPQTSDIIPARKVTDAHALQFVTNNELLLPILKAFAECTSSTHATRNAWHFQPFFY
jgi:hypothetical protein